MTQVLRVSKDDPEVVVLLITCSTAISHRLELTRLDVLAWGRRLLCRIGSMVGVGQAEVGALPMPPFQELRARRGWSHCLPTISLASSWIRSCSFLWSKDEPNYLVIQVRRKLAEPLRCA